MDNINGDCRNNTYRNRHGDMMMKAFCSITGKRCKIFGGCPDYKRKSIMDDTCKFKELKKHEIPK